MLQLILITSDLIAGGAKAQLFVVTRLLDWVCQARRASVRLKCGSVQAIAFS
jgi:hypothetical protein